MKKINFVDIIIVAALLLVCFVVGFYFANLAGGGEKLTGEDTVVYQLRIKEAREDIVKEIQKNPGKIFNSDKDLYIGDIKNVEVNDYTLYSPSENSGEFVETTVPGRYEILLDVEAKGKYTEGKGAVVNSIEIFAGKTCNIKGANYAAVSTVMSMEKVK